MCFNVFYHVQCVAESTTKDIPTRNIGYITNSRFVVLQIVQFWMYFLYFCARQLLTEFLFYICSNVNYNICTKTNQTLACGSMSQ